MALVKRMIQNGRITGPVYTALKGRLQDRQARLSKARYVARANAEGMALPSESELRQILRHRLSNRSHGRWPKKRGDLNIFLLYHTRDWEVALPVSLRPFGEVTEYDYAAKGYSSSSTAWLQQRERLNVDVLEAFHRANAVRPVDCVVAYVSGRDISPQTLYQMSDAGAAIFNFCWDDKLNFPGKKLGGRYVSPAAIAPAVDLNLTNAPDSVVKYMVHGGLAMFWPEAALPPVEVHPLTPFDVDVSFVGSCYGWRPAFIKQLADRGVEVRCYGRGWPSGPISQDEMLRIFSRSRINLGFATIGYSRRLMCLKGRDFELPAAGCLYLTQHNPELELVYDVGKEIVTYRDVDDCCATIRKLLADPQLADRIRAAGRGRCLADHTYERRWSDLFSFAGIL